MVLEKARIYGVDGVGQSSPSLTRTDAAEGMTFTKGASEIKSDFDKWLAMYSSTFPSSIPKSRKTQTALTNTKYRASAMRASLRFSWTEKATRLTMFWSANMRQAEVRQRRNRRAERLALLISHFRK